MQSTNCQIAPPGEVQLPPSGRDLPTVMPTQMPPRVRSCSAEVKFFATSLARRRVGSAHHRLRSLSSRPQTVPKAHRPQEKICPKIAPFTETNYLNRCLIGCGAVARGY